VRWRSYPGFDCRVNALVPENGLSTRALSHLHTPPAQLFQFRSMLWISAGGEVPELIKSLLMT
jgi:hypothetical protein